MSNLYYQKTTVRWSDLDANRHLANASYMQFTSFARIAFLRDFGITMNDLGRMSLGPAILHEEFSFFKEAHEGDEIYITVEIAGMSDDGMLYIFNHNLYRSDGTHLCHSELFGVWFDLNTRKMIAPPAEFTASLRKSFDGKEVTILTKADLANLSQRPKNIDPTTFTASL